jgi:demethoxyubiquinone hydroxylase (CLK1/Coq7/Cat5 family)
MESETDIRNWIIRALLSENQAIGIYEAEVYWKKYPQETFNVILSDEKNHFCKMEQYLKDNAWTYSTFTRIGISLYQFSGWVIGTILSLLPRKLCFHFHTIAEKKAAREYENIVEELNKNKKFERKQQNNLKNLMQGMINNENIHSEIFKYHSNIFHG